MSAVHNITAKILPITADNTPVSVTVMLISCVFLVRYCIFPIFVGGCQCLATLSSCSCQCFISMCDFFIDEQINDDDHDDDDKDVNPHLMKVCH